MIAKNEIAYWMALAHVPEWRYEKINTLIIKIVHEEKISLEGFFNSSMVDWAQKFQLSDRDISDLQNTQKELPNYSFLAEDLLEQGYKVIPINSPMYSETLKENLKTKHAPPILYLKGNERIMQENSVAIAGSRDASKMALQFADNIAKLASKEYKVVVSGFAKGVDKQALDSAIKYKGQSIIVLPQGIMTFASGFKRYYKQIVDGDVLILSTFFPKAPWSTQLAMARNPIIFGLAKEIYVAESRAKGGTWAGVIDGLRKRRTIFVRNPEPSEKNANKLLIERGAIPVDFDGCPIPHMYKEIEAKSPIVEEPSEALENKIYNILRSGELTSKEIVQKAQIDLTPAKLTHYLKTLKDIEIINKKPLKFRLKNGLAQTRLFT
jgi:DNA processing protein